jgi:hypothetical protein
MRLTRRFQLRMDMAKLPDEEEIFVVCSIKKVKCF